MNGTEVTQSAIRTSGLINAIAGACVGIAYVLHPHHATPEVVTGGFWLTIHLLFAVSLLGGVLGAMGIFARHSPHTGWSGLLGFVCVVAALTLIFGLNYFEALINPVVAAEFPAFIDRYGAGETIGLVSVVFPASGALFVVGYLLLCRDVARAKSLPPASAWLTMAGVVIFGAGLSGFLPMLVVQVGAVVFALGLIWMGLALAKTVAGPATAALIVAFIAPGFFGPALTAQTNTLIPFEIEDQFETVHQASDYADRILIVIASDRDGSEFNAGWGIALTEALEDREGFDRVAMLPVADLTGVPFFLKGMIRGRFPEDPEQWVAMDWDGEFDEAYNFVEGSSNILVFAPGGRLIQRAHGREVDDAVLESLVSPIRVLLLTGG